MKHQMDLVQEFHQVMQVHTPSRPTMPCIQIACITSWSSDYVIWL